MRRPGSNPARPMTVMRSIRIGFFSVFLLAAPPPLSAIGIDTNAANTAFDPAIALAARERSATIWPHMRAGFALQTADNDRVARHVSWFQKHPDYLKRVMERADIYLHLVLEEVQARGLPAEIALLPVVESSFRPFAYSHGRAAGLWQFIPGTGKRFGLKQNWWYDGRRDVLASTQAALDYLEYLHDHLKGDWLLALAAYNSGEGTVNRAVQKNRNAGRPTDFWHLKLPRETREYVPKLLALRRIIETPEAYGIQLEPIADQPRLTTVETGGQIDLALAAELADISLDTVYELNPGFNRWATDPEGPHQLLLPIASAEVFRERLSELPPDARIQWARHKVRRGQTLSHIARQHGTTVAVLRDVNELRNDSIRVDQYLIIPVARKNLDQYALSANERRRKVRSQRRSGTKLVHTVDQGDTLWDLSRQYKVKVRELARWNAMAPGDPLRKGRKIVIWQQPPATAAAGRGSALQSIHYTVRKGDSLARISRRFKVTINDLVKWNGIPRNAYLRPGQRLKLYVDVTEQADS